MSNCDLNEAEEIEKSLSSLTTLRRSLSEIVYLIKEHNFKISLESYTEWSSMEVAHAMIDRVSAPELLAMEVGQHVSNYCRYCTLDCDDVLGKKLYTIV